MDCLLPEGVYQPSDLELAYVRESRGRFYRVRWDTVMAEPATHGTWLYTRVPARSEVATATAGGLPSAALARPDLFSDLSPIQRDLTVLRHDIGAGERWIPSIVILGNARVAHGWIYGIDLAATGQSAIAANALRYQIAVQRCEQDAAAAADRNAELARRIANRGAGPSDPSAVLATTLLTTSRGADADSATADLAHNLDIFHALEAGKAAPPATDTVRSGMAVAVVGTLVVVGALGLIVWAAGGSK